MLKDVALYHVRISINSAHASALMHVSLLLQKPFVAHIIVVGLLQMKKPRLRKLDTYLRTQPLSGRAKALNQGL